MCSLKGFDFQRESTFRFHKHDGEEKIQKKELKIEIYLVNGDQMNLIFNHDINLENYIGVVPIHDQFGVGHSFVDSLAFDCLVDSKDKEV